MTESKCNVGVPMSESLKISKDDCPTTEDERERMSQVQYRNAIGALMYLATAQGLILLMP
jgi:hypothetical protein